MRIVDRVAYINHDIDDAIRYGILEQADLPQDEIDMLGPSGPSGSTRSSTIWSSRRRRRATSSSPKRSAAR